MQSSNVPLVRATVTPLPEIGRGRMLAGRQYRPHIVLGPIDQRHALVADGNVLTEKYLGVVFWSGPEWLRSGVEAQVELALAYWSAAPDEYAQVLPGATFTLREGSSIVGFGVVQSRTDPQPTTPLHH